MIGPIKGRGVLVAKSVESNYTVLMGLGTWVLAETCRQREERDTRREKKARVVGRKWKMLTEAFPKDAAELRRDRRTVCEYIDSRFRWNDARRREYLVDLTFTDPFAPWQLKTGADDVRAGVEMITAHLGVDDSFLDEVESIRKAATRAHRSLDVRKVALYGLGGAAVLGTGGFLAAPAIGAMLGGVAGLSGAAATSAGLAALGGGSLAAGGFGMAGGIAVVTGITAAGGAAVGSGSQLLMQLGARATRAELIKLQTNYRAVLLHDELHLEKAKRVSEGLHARLVEVEKTLAEERKLNDKNSGRLKELEEIIDALNDASRFVSRSQAQAA